MQQVQICQSESIRELTKAMIQFKLKNDINCVPDKVNPVYNSKYVSLSAMIQKFTKPLAEHGIIFMFFTTDSGSLDTVTLSCELIHESGEWKRATLNLPVVPELLDMKIKFWDEATRKNVTQSHTIQTAYTPQKAVGSLTYGKRAALGSLLGISIEEDDDGNSASSKQWDTDYPQNNGSYKNNASVQAKPKSQTTPQAEPAKKEAKPKVSETPPSEALRVEAEGYYNTLLSKGIKTLQGSKGLIAIETYEKYVKNTADWISLSEDKGKNIVNILKTAINNS